MGAVFEGRAPTAERYVWDQHVHTWHGERCVLIFLALPAVSESSRTDVEGIIGANRVVSQSCYLAYGLFDIVVRMWCTSDEKDKIVDALNVKYQHPDMEVFDVVDIDYTRWSTADPATEEKVVAFLDDIRKFSEGSDNPIVPERLLQAGLLHLHHLEAIDEQETTFVRVNILLRRRYADSGSVSRLEALDRSIGALNYLEMPSIYYGNGRSIDCVIKGFVKAQNVPTFHHHVLGLRQNLENAQIDLRPMTLILAQDGEVDRDFLRLDIPTGWESPDVRRLQAVLQTDAAVSWEQLDDGFKKKVASTFGEVWAEVSDSTFARPLLDLIEGLVLEDEYRVNGSLAFLMVLETKVRRAYFTRLLPEVANSLGSPGDWPGAIRVFLKSMDPGDDKKKERQISDLISRLEEPRTLGLGQLTWLVDGLIELGVITKAQVDGVVGARSATLPVAFKVRNEFAHGNMLLDLETGSEQWWDSHASSVISAGRLLASLEQVEER